MNRQRKGLGILLLALAVCLSAYGGIRIYKQKQEEKEARDKVESEIQIVSASTEDITEFSYLVDGKEMVFVKEDDSWSSRGTENTDLDETEIETMLETITGLQVTEEILSYESLEEYGLVEPSNTIVLRTEETEEVLYVGNENEIIGGCYLKKEDSAAVYLVEEEE